MIWAISARTEHSPRTFFETPPMLITFISLGRWLEHIAKGKTSEALATLMKMAPQEAALIKFKDGKVQSTEIVNINLVEKDDLIMVKPGEKIPVDGRIIDGKSSCDEAFITGEAMPVSKNIGDSVYAGSINQNGNLIVKATHVGTETNLQQIGKDFQITKRESTNVAGLHVQKKPFFEPRLFFGKSLKVKIMEEAQTSKAPIQQTADIVAGYFVPVICTLSLMTLIGWLIGGFNDPKIIPDQMEYSMNMTNSEHHLKHHGKFDEIGNQLNNFNNQTETAESKKV